LLLNFRIVLELVPDWLVQATTIAKTVRLNGPACAADRRCISSAQLARWKVLYLVEIAP
jgi:hypothetical protein